MVVLLPSEEDVLVFILDFELIKRVEGRGFIITAAAPALDPLLAVIPPISAIPGGVTAFASPALCRYDFFSRCFYPKLDMPEDSVTGSEHTYLTPIWAATHGRAEMTARQLSRRAGTLRVRLAGDRVFITGSARLFMSGDIPSTSNPPAGYALFAPTLQVFACRVPPKKRLTLRVRAWGDLPAIAFPEYIARIIIFFPRVRVFFDCSRGFLHIIRVEYVFPTAGRAFSALLRAV